MQANKERDKLVNRQLRKMGWRVVRVWEHELKVSARVGSRMKKALQSAQTDG